MPRPLSCLLRRVFPSCREANLHHLRHSARPTACTTTRPTAIIQASKRHQSTSTEGARVLSVAEAVEKEFWGPRGLALVDKSLSTTSSPLVSNWSIRILSTHVQQPQDPLRSHLESAAVDGHLTSMDHGPPNLLSMLDYWRDHCAASRHIVQEIKYRAVAPVYAGETYEISAGEAQKVAGEDGGLTWDIVVSKDGKTCMTGSILGGLRYLNLHFKRYRPHMTSVSVRQVSSHVPAIFVKVHVCHIIAEVSSRITRYQRKADGISGSRTGRAGRSAHGLLPMTAKMVDLQPILATKP
ncbi:hypothetical protein FHL15_009162 [Xylaria flabelliformis]|uniref:Thioesterase domain-containing protein n=1 Tax=Xylaria flabelliformis TaxID=2512241 RepID=A0A553HPN6_9PEZI|nr:hypothetical protein FHL15_009162 [Xylaria flabelliformis]